MTTTQRPEDGLTDAEREAKWDAILKADSLERARNAEIDPYVDGGAKIDWFNRSESFNDIDARLDRQALELDDIRQAANIERKRAQELFSVGHLVDADSAHALARELDAQVNSTARRVLRNGRLFAERFTHAAEEGRWVDVANDLVVAIKSPDADHALKVACTQCLTEITPLIPDNDGDAFDARWLVDRAGLPLRTAQELLADARKLESGIAALLIDTEMGSRKAVQEIANETPSRQREIASAVRACLPQYLIEHGIATEKRKRSGSLSVTEMRALTFIERNEETGWKHVLALSPSQRTIWLGQKIEARERRLEIDERRSKRTDKIIRQIKADQRNKVDSRRRNADQTDRKVS